MDNEYIVIVDYKTGSFLSLWSGREKYNAASNMRETGRVNMFISRTFMLIPDMLLWISTIAGTGNGFVMTGKEICWKKENWSILSPRLCDGALYGFLWNARDGVSILYS